MTLLTSLAFFLAAALLGAMIFFPAVVAPTVFKVLEPDAASRFLRTLFPAYYQFIIVVAGLLVGVGAILSLPIALLALAITLSTLWVRQILVPRINGWRDQEMDGDTQAAAKFKYGHRLSVLINLVQMAALILTLFVLSQA